MNSEFFDFSDQSFLDEISALGKKHMDEGKIFKKDHNRGSKHFIYMNRTFFGLYNLMFSLKAENIEINRYKGL